MKFLLLALLLGSIFILTTLSTQTRYDNHKVVRANITREQIPIIEAFDCVDVWNDYLTVGLNDFCLNPEQIRLFESVGINFEVLIPDVQALIDEERRALASPTASFFDIYQRYASIVAYLNQLATTYNQIATFVPSIGTTIEGRPIPALLISSELGKNNTKKQNADKYTIFISGGQHAREWISPSTVLYIFTQLLEQYGVDTRITNIVNAFNYVLVPLVNPDGYEFSQTTTRLWRKNRRNNVGGTFGVDLNRNWDHQWGGTGSSKTPSSDTYCGTGPFSEPETKAVANFFMKTGSIVGAIDYHSYGQLILRPWGDTRTNPPNNDKLTELGTLMRSAILSAGGVAYTSQKSYDLYPTTGSADDWYYDNAAKIKLVYTFEVRDTGKNGFILPTSEIIPTGKENLAAFIVFAEYVKKQLDN